jgi:gas vesicle protein
MDSKNLIGGLLAGAAIGVAIGLLFAPTSGKQARQKLSEGSRKLTDSLKDSMEESLDVLKNKFTAGVEEVTRKGKDTYTSAKDGIAL